MERKEALTVGLAVQHLLGRLIMKSKEQRLEKEEKLGKVKVVEEEEEEEERGVRNKVARLNLQMRLPPLQTKTQTMKIPLGHSQEVDRHQVVPWIPRSQNMPSIWVWNPLYLRHHQGL